MNTKQIHLTSIVPPESAGLRLDQVVVKLWPEYSRAQHQTWIKAGHVTLNEQVCTLGKTKVTAGVVVTLETALAARQDWSAQAIPLEVVFEDETLLVVHKPAGLVVHPGAGNPDQTLVNALLHYCPSLCHLPRAGILHRLDKDTSGLLIVAKTSSAFQILSDALKARSIKREYLALVRGQVTTSGRVEAPIGRHPSQRTKMAIHPTGRHAVSHYRVKERFAHFTLLHVQLETGRTHQIRVHMEHLRHPVVGDSTYGRHLALPTKIQPEIKQALQGLGRQALHAWRLGFSHPVTQQVLNFEAPVPTELSELLQVLREHDAC